MDSSNPAGSAQAETQGSTKDSQSRFDEILHLLDVEAKGIKPFKYRFRIWEFLALILVITTYFSFMHWLARASIPWSAAYAVGIAVVCVMWPLNMCRYMARIAERLPYSDIVNILAVGPPHLAKIYDYTPWPWSILILGPRPRRLREWIKLLSRNLDWYLEEPRTLIRLEWIGYFIGWALYFILSFHITVQSSSPLNWFLLVCVTVIPASILGGFGKTKRRLSATLLRDYLRERMADDEDEKPAG